MTPRNERRTGAPFLDEAISSQKACETPSAKEPKVAHTKKERGRERERDVINWIQDLAQGAWSLPSDPRPGGGVRIHAAR